MKKKNIIMLILLMILLMPSVNAKSMKATDYIKKIADDAGGNPNSVEAIGNTSLAYDGTTDNNLRYVGENPNNYVKFNDELWRIIGVMNNVEDKSGNKAPKLKLIRFETLSSVYNYDIRDLSINSWVDQYNIYQGGGVNEWSESSLYKLLNPGFDNYVLPEYSTTEKVNNSLYWNSSSGKGLRIDYTFIGSGKYRNYIKTYNINFTENGIKNEAKEIIANAKWNTGTIPMDIDIQSKNELYNYERGDARKCTSNSTTCNDQVERKNSTYGRIGLIYPSDVAFSMVIKDITWMNNALTISPTYNDNNGSYIKSIASNYSNNKREIILQNVPAGSRNYYSIYPTIYLDSTAKIVGGEGKYHNPYIIQNKNYEDKTSSSNKTIQSSFKGNYSIDNLSSNYSIITFGTKDKNGYSYMLNAIKNTKKGDVKELSYVEGPVLINGDFTYSGENGYFSTKNNNDESFIKGNLGSNMLTTSKVITNKDYVNFEEMYAKVVNEQNTLVNNTEEHINNENIIINKPGIYMLNNTSLSHDIMYSYISDYNNYNYYNSLVRGNKKIYINNYNKNSNYIFNIMNTHIIGFYEVFVKAENDPNFVSLNTLAESGEYPGNIFFNCPNARFISIYNAYGTLIAPKADVFIPATRNGANVVDNNNLQLFVNSITGDNNGINFVKKQTTEKLIKNSEKNYVVEPKDYDDDIYTYDYSLKSLLENYSIVSFGKKEFDSKTKYATLGNYNKGNVGIFHIDGQFLINGDLGTNEYDYPGQVGFTNNAMRIDLDSNLITESNISGQERRPISIKYWKMNGDWPIEGSKNQINGNQNGEKQFINYDRLYDNVIAETKAIKPGQDVEVKNRKAHIKVGTNYVINDINEIDEIIFDDFENNKNKMTMITIQNTGDINFPKMSADTIGLIETNDYYGKPEATYQYEIDRDFTEHYHGNIVWNVPNATYIKLAANAPFAGHLIAPKADVESPETHFSGCFIVNSLYCEGNTEAHFYPLTATEMDETYIDSKGKVKTKRTDVATVLGEDNSIIEMKVVGDKEEYERDKNKQSITELLVNPATYGNLFVIIIILLAPGVLVARYKTKINR